ncbi:MAG: hypothetical protein AAGL17_10210, partial [Cyanobacteria bacterium J06576_12]
EMFSAEDTPPIQNLKALALFFDKEMKLGRIKSVGSQAVTLQFIGSLISYVFLSQLSGPLQEPKDYVDSTIESLWQGVKP